MPNKTIQLKADGTKLVFGRRLSKAEKKQIRRSVTGHRLVEQAKRDNPAVTIRMSPALKLVLGARK